MHALHLTRLETVFSSFRFVSGLDPPIAELQFQFLRTLKAATQKIQFWHARPLLMPINFDANQFTENLECLRMH